MVLATRQFNIVIQPGWRNSGPSHWQSYWESQLDATRVNHDNWDTPERDIWLAALDRAVKASNKPVVVIAHSLGCITLAHYAKQHHTNIAAALLVAPADVERANVPDQLKDFGPIPSTPLPFPSWVVASTNDPFCQAPKAAHMARQWQAPLFWLDNAGHINVDSGHHQWHEGLLLLDKLLASHSAAICA